MITSHYCILGSEKCCNVNEIKMVWQNNTLENYYLTSSIEPDCLGSKSEDYIFFLATLAKYLEPVLLGGMYFKCFQLIDLYCDFS